MWNTENMIMVLFYVQIRHYYVICENKMSLDFVI